MKNTITLTAAIILAALLLAAIAADSKNAPQPTGATSPIAITTDDSGQNVYLSYTINRGATHELVIFRSADAGLNWRRVPPPNIHWIGQSDSPDQK